MFQCFFPTRLLTKASRRITPPFKENSRMVRLLFVLAVPIVFYVVDQLAMIEVLASIFCAATLLVLVGQPATQNTVCKEKVVPIKCKTTRELSEKKGAIRGARDVQPLPADTNLSDKPTGSRTRKRTGVRSINQAICTAAREGNVSEVESIMAQILQQCRKPDVATYSSLIYVNLKNNNTQRAEYWFEEMRRTGITATPVIYNIFIDWFAKFNDHATAEIWIKRMIEDNLCPSESSFSTMIQACVKRGERDAAGHWLHKLEDFGLTVPASCYHSMIVACARDSDVLAATMWLDQAEGKGLHIGVQTYSVLIGACAKASDVHTAERFMARMSSKGVTPNSATFNMVIDACVRSRRPDRAVEWQRKMLDMGIIPHGQSAGTLVRTLATSGAPEAAAMCLAMLMEVNVPFDVVPFGAVIDAFAKQGDTVEAQKHFDLMRVFGMKPNVVCYSALARAYSKHGMWQEIERLDEEMESNQIAMNEYFLSAHLLAYRPEFADRAEKVFLKAAAKNVPINRFVVTALFRSVSRKRARELAPELIDGAFNALVPLADAPP